MFYHIEVYFLKKYYFIDKKRVMFDEETKKNNKDSNIIINKEKAITKEIKEEKKNDCEISNDEDDSYMSKDSDETDNKIDILKQVYLCDHNNNFSYNGISGDINNNCKSNINNDKNIDNNNVINNNNNVKNDIDNVIDNNEKIMDNNDNNKNNKNIDDNKKNDKLILKKKIDNKINKKEKKEKSVSKSITSNKDNNEIKTLKNYEIKCDFDRNELFKQSLNKQNNNIALYSNKTNNSFLNDVSHNNENTNSIFNKNSYKLNKIDDKKYLKKVTYKDKIMKANIFPKINGNKKNILLNADNNNFNINKYTEITDNNDSSNLDNEQNSRSISAITSKIQSKINSKMASNLTSNLTSNLHSNRNSLTKTNDDNINRFIGTKNYKSKRNATPLSINSKDKYFNCQTNLQINTNSLRPIIPPSDCLTGVNYVGLNVDNIKTQEDDDDDDLDDFRISMSGKRLHNLRLEGIGISSPNSQKIERKKVRLQGISTEPPLKISAAFGRTAYTFINNDNQKNKLHSIKLVKRKKDVNKSNLDVFFGPNNK